MSLLFSLAISLQPPALAADLEGIPITVRVVDTEGQPIPTASVRHPKEKQRHKVNTKTGEWTDSVLYLDDGTEFFFEKGMQLHFEVSAPEYANADIVYEMRKRRNVVVVQLEEMAVVVDTSDIVIQFGRDTPLDR